MATVRHLGLFPHCFTGYQDRLISLNDSVEMYWRVKAWQVDIVGNGNSSSSITSMDDPDNYNIFQNPPSNEKDLVCLDFFTFGTFETPLFYAGGVLSFGYDIDFEVGTGGAEVSNFGVRNGGDEIGQLTLQAIGKTYTLGLYIGFEQDPQGGLETASATITAVEYWPYDPNDGGGPIYNTGTGERIRFDV